MALQPLAGVLLGASLLAGCGGGSDGGSGNSAPQASFTASATSGAAPLPVNFDASASTDADGITAYSWTFGDVSGGATGVTTSHTYTTGGSYVVTLTVTDSKGATGQTTRTVEVTAPPPTSVIVSGTVTYDRVPFSLSVSNSVGLDYAAIVEKPVRGAVAELLDSSAQTLLATTTTSATGQYAFTAPISTNVKVRIKARTVATGSPSWDISILNNTNGSALYALDSAAFNTGTANVIKDLNAPSGWPDLNGTSYSGFREAAPFAVLDTLYSAVQFVLTQGSAAVNLPPLKAFWSPANKPAAPTISCKVTDGCIDSTLYQNAPSDQYEAGMYILGAENVDTDEYDESVIAHEFLHFLENTVSRSDTPGGSHALGEKLDMRLAYSEGFANAFSSMVRDDPEYRDSFDRQQSSSFNFNVETDTFGTPGWFNEESIQALVWDIYDGASDPADAVQMGFAPLFSVFSNEMRTGQALTSIFPLATALKNQSGAPVPALNTLIGSQDIRATDIDPFGSTETNDGGVAEALPLYTDVSVNGPAARVCGSATAGTNNKIGNRRFLKFDLATAGTITIQVTAIGAGSPVPDPDFWLYGDGTPQGSESGTPNIEQATFSLPAGGYVIEVYEFSHIDPSNGVRGVTCMNVTVAG